MAGLAVPFAAGPAPGVRLASATQRVDTAAEAGHAGAASRTDTLFRQHHVSLAPTHGWEFVSGRVRLAPRWSPFDVAVSADGHFRYELEMTVWGLPDPTPESGVDGYVAWLTTPELDPVRRLGRIRNGEPVTTEVEWNKFLVVVSVEGPAERPEGEDLEDAGRWTGPVVLVGRSRSAELRSLTGHSIYDRAEF